MRALIAASDTTNFIACLLSEDQQVHFREHVGAAFLPVIRYMANLRNPR